MLKRVVRLLIAFPAALLLITLAVSNRHSVRMILDPFRPERPALAVDMPFYFFLFGALVVGVVLGGWIFATGWITFSDTALRVSAVVLIVSVVALGAPRPFGRDEVVRSPAAIGAITGGVALVVTQWWRPCVGEQLGSILTHAPARPVSQLLPTIGFMLGISVPLVAIGLVRAVWPPAPPTAARLGSVGCGLAVVLGASVLAGRHGEIVSRLFAWSR